MRKLLNIWSFEMLYEIAKNEHLKHIYVVIKGQLHPSLTTLRQMLCPDDLNDDETMQI